MSLYVVDVESDGPCPGEYSMVSLGVVRVDRQMLTTYKACFHPISEQWVPEALAISGITRDDMWALPHREPYYGMLGLQDFLTTTNVGGRPTFLSDNPAFDWQWVNYYFHRYLKENPFGFSARRIGDFYAGLERDFGAATAWKKFRRTAHTHDPVDDAKGNVEALLHFCDAHGIKLPGCSV